MPAPVSKSTKSPAPPDPPPSFGQSFAHLVDAIVSYDRICRQEAVSAADADRIADVRNVTNERIARHADAALAALKRAAI